MNKHLLCVAAIAAIAGCKSGGGAAMRADIQAKLASAQPPIQECFQRVVTTNRKVRGMMVLQMATNADGQFIDVNTLRDEPANPVLRFCVVQELGKLRLDKPPGKRVEITSVPIKFEWTNP